MGTMCANGTAFIPLVVLKKDEIPCCLTDVNNG